MNVVVANIPEILPGTLVDFAGPTAPAGWMFCAGQSLSRTGFADLFSVIGTTYGSVDANSFSLPDIRGRVCAGKDNMGGTDVNRLGAWYIDGRVLGASGGEMGHALSAYECPNHFHDWWPWPVSGSGLLVKGPPVNYSWQATATSGGAGSNSPHQNSQPILVLNKIIKI